MTERVPVQVFELEKMVKEMLDIMDGYGPPDSADEYRAQWETYCQEFNRSST